MKEEADILIDWCERAICHHTANPAPAIGEYRWWNNEPYSTIEQQTWEEQVEYMISNNPPEQQKALFDYLQPESTEFRFLDSGFQRFVFTDGECVVKVPIYWHSQEIDCTQDYNPVYWEDWAYPYMVANHSAMTDFYLEAETFGYEGIVKMPIVTPYDGNRLNENVLFNDEWREQQNDTQWLLANVDDTTNNYAIHDGRLVCIDYWTILFDPLNLWV
jgi:hypothetical protein